MIKRLVIELTESLCRCPESSIFALDIESIGNVFEFQITCEKCQTHLAVPLSELRALIKIVREDEYSPPSKTNKPKLTLIRGGLQ